MKWIRASETPPKENAFQIFRWLDTRDVFRKTLKSLRDENGNIGGLPLLEWLDESTSKEGEEEAVDGWISVEDKPTQSGEYIVFDPNRFGKNKIDVYRYDDYQDSWVFGSDAYHPSHYKPLPKPPFKQSKGTTG